MSEAKNDESKLNDLLCELDYKLPCNVKIENGIRIKAGCSFYTLAIALKSRMDSEQRMTAPNFNQDKYLNDLWACYRNGVDVEELDDKELFKSLIADLIEQVKAA